jgi:hypothetical protein
VQPHPAPQAGLLLFDAGTNLEAFCSCSNIYGRSSCPRISCAGVNADVIANSSALREAPSPRLPHARLWVRRRPIPARRFAPLHNVRSCPPIWRVRCRNHSLDVGSCSGSSSSDASPGKKELDPESNVGRVLEAQITVDSPA